MIIAIGLIATVRNRFVKLTNTVRMILDEATIHFSELGATRNLAVDYYKAALDANKVDKYNKIGFVWARPAKTGEKVVTMIGTEKETENTAKQGDMVVTANSGEQYIIGGEKFTARYDATSIQENGQRKYKAKGSCFAVKYSGPTISFQAPWGEKMIAHKGDYIASTSKEGFDDIYRIEKKIFESSYKEA